MNSKRDVLIFWFKAPPKVSKGAFNYTTKNWGNKVIYVINNDFPDYRKATNWNDGDFGDAELIFLSEYENKDEVIENIFLKYPNAIHVVQSFTNVIQQQIRKYIFRPNINLVVFTERPDQMGNLLERCFREVYFKIKYTRLRRLFEPYTDVFLPLGQKGVETFQKYGWARDKMFPFMYNPIIVKNNEKKEINLLSANNKIKFLYVGRFYYKTKGIDILMSATKYLKGNWQLDLVGGYGKDKDKVIEWAQKHPNVNYIGSWQSQDVCNKMVDYDVVVVPSKYDGWNLLPNEAIHAGIGTITTIEAVSDEMITASGAGLVVPSRNPQLMAEALQTVIDTPSLAREWGIRADAYVKKIQPETVGGYFMDILDYTFYNNGQNRPICPWL